MGDSVWLFMGFAVEIGWRKDADCTVARDPRGPTEASQRFAELAQAIREQARTTDARFAELAQAQARTEQSVQELSRSMQGMRQEIGALGSRLGSDLEEFAAEVVPHYLRHEEGIEVGPLEPSEPPELATEFDWVGPARRGDRELRLLIESKTTGASQRPRTRSRKAST